MEPKKGEDEEEGKETIEPVKVAEEPLKEQNQANQKETEKTD